MSQVTSGDELNLVSKPRAHIVLLTAVRQPSVFAVPFSTHALAYRWISPALSVPRLNRRCLIGLLATMLTQLLQTRSPS